jgi:hypothetical protein
MQPHRARNDFGRGRPSGRPAVPFRNREIAAAVVAMLLLTFRLHAQVATGTILGNVVPGIRPRIQRRFRSSG